MAIRNATVNQRIAEIVLGWKRGAPYGNGNGEWIIPNAPDPITRLPATAGRPATTVISMAGLARSCITWANTPDFLGDARHTLTVLAALADHVRKARAHVRVGTPDPFVTWNCAARGKFVAEIVLNDDDTARETIIRNEVGDTFGEAVCNLAIQYFTDLTGKEPHATGSKDRHARAARRRQDRGRR